MRGSVCTGLVLAGAVWALYLQPTPAKLVNAALMLLLGVAIGYLLDGAVGRGR